jgi:hypothetical protein
MFIEINQLVRDSETWLKHRQNLPLLYIIVGIYICTITDNRGKNMRIIDE